MSGSNRTASPRPHAELRRPWLIGMVHVGALPGTPFAERPLDRLAAEAADEAALLVEAGFDAILIENMHDRPYLLRNAVGPEAVAGMTRIGLAIRAAIGPQVPLGVQILAGANRAALATALALAGPVAAPSGGGAAGATDHEARAADAGSLAGVDRIASMRPLADLAPDGSFVRVEGFVFASVADEGLIADADAGDLLRYRRAIGADGGPRRDAPVGGARLPYIPIFADIKKKHSSHTITADVSLTETAHAADFFEVDGLIVTGLATGHPTAPDDVQAVRAATARPVLVGSGVTPDRAEALAKAGADGLIVGSWYKCDGQWHRPPDPARARELVAAFRAIAVAARA